MPLSKNKIQSLFFNSTFLVVYFAIFFSEDQPIGRESKETFFYERHNKISNYQLKQTAWVDSTMATMSLDQKIGQLFMVSTFSNRNEAEYRKIEEQIAKYHLGGLIFFQGTPLKQAELTNRYQSRSKIPLMIGIDAEWGIGMRLDDTETFPKAITLGATGNPEVVEKVGFVIGQQCKRMGIHINFAPDVDINSNPKNPVINFRSFGESSNMVASLARAYGKGLKRAGIMGSAKHFPGHGDTDIDSHRSLPILNHSKKHLEEIETIPFKALIADSVASIMIGHLHVPSLDNEANISASVSRKVITGYLKEELNYKGLVFTDALNMRGLLRYFPTGEAEVKAFEAGNDILLQTANLEVAFNALKTKFLDSTLNISDLDQKVKKILQAKYWVGLNKFKPIELRNLMSDINNSQIEEVKSEVFSNSVTVVKDDRIILPFKSLNTLTFTSVAISAKSDNVFQKTLSLYGNTKNITMPYKPAKSSDWSWVADEAAKSDVVIISVHDLHNLESRNYGVVPETIALIRAIAEKTAVVVCVFGNPYCLKLFDEFETVVCGYEDENAAFVAVANILYGVNASVGKIPVNTLSKEAKLNDGIKTLQLDRLGYATPSTVGMNKLKLEKINEVISQCIKEGEFPGCQVLVARKGKVVFHKSYGNQRYGLDEPVDNQSIFDLASLTKVTATLQAVMMLYDQKKIDLNQTLSYYLPNLNNTNKSEIKIKDILLHQAGLKAFIPFWTNTKKGKGNFNSNYYSFQDSSKIQLTVAENLFIIPSIKDSVLKWIAESPLIFQKGEKRYEYSDLGLILLQRVVEQITKMPLDEYLNRKIYYPLGMTNTSFNPLNKIEINRIMPTEVDNTFREKAIKGTVHDSNAALLGGVAGHAGLFSNSWDLAKLLQMNLNKGIYSGENFFTATTISLFTSKQTVLSHRGLGWNKPSVNDGSVSKYASDLTYGHTGFTGTAAWIDPEKELIFIFLSNRVYPNAENNKIIKNKTRRRIHDLVYEAIEK